MQRVGRVADAPSDRSCIEKTDEGSASLKDLFRGRSQLLVYHFIRHDEYVKG
jgi:predicted dithiol-disulfide oxidoreductase (DUF899 family)